MIKTIEVRNFRNIPNGKYDLSKRCAFAGKNFTGKTNLLNAVFWVLTDKLLGDSSDAQSLKPTNDKKQEVSVKIIFNDEHYIEKTYKEKWVTTRGTGIERLEGHETKTIIDDLVVPQSKVSERIRQDFLGIVYSTNSKVDLSQMLIDPLYLWENTSMKERRAFLIELVGDVDIEKVYENESIANNVYLPATKEKISYYKGNISNAMAFFRNNVKKQNDEISMIEYQLAGERNKVDVDASELEVAESRVKELNDLIDSRKQMKATMVNPRIAAISSEISQKQEQINEIVKQTQDDWKKTVEINKLENQQVNEMIVNNEKEIRKLYDLKQDLKGKLNSNNLTINNNKTAILVSQKIVEQTRKEYMEIQTREFRPVNLPEALTCPHCGGIINQEILEQINTQNEENRRVFNDQKLDELSKVRERGHAAKNDIERFELEVTELLKQNLSLDSEIAKQDQKIEELSTKNNQLRTQLKPVPEMVVSEQYHNALKELEELKYKLDIEKKIDYTADIDSEISSYKEEIKKYDNILSAHRYYVYTQEVILKLENDLETNRKIRAAEESKLMLCELILTTKLDMLRKHVETVFGDIEIKLVESNIKEGSWNEVCYPTIIDEKTGSRVPFENASRSQKYIYGIRLLEAIRRATNSTVAAPILIDEIGTFDSETISQRIKTDAQIIATKCEDSFDKPTIINL